MHHIVLENRQRKRQLITKLSLPDGRTETTQAAIVEAFAAHYRRFYQEDNNEDGEENDVLRYVSHTLDATSAASLLEEISRDDIEDAIDKAALNKAPGPDGLPIEFYRTFRTLMMPRWINMYRQLMSQEDRGLKTTVQ